VIQEKKLPYLSIHIKLQYLLIVFNTFEHHI